jgi:3-methyladenine DNA glycosylase AlkC
MAEPLKNIFFTRASLAQLAERVQHEYPQFDADRFLALIFDADWPARELKERMRHVARCLGQTLPSDYARALDILKPVAQHITGFDAMVFPDFVEVFGSENWDRSLAALAHFTRFGSAEFAVRPFLHRDPKCTLADVRRLASTGGIYSYAGVTLGQTPQKSTEASSLRYADVRGSPSPSNSKMASMTRRGSPLR